MTGAITLRHISQGLKEFMLAEIEANRKRGEGPTTYDGIANQALQARYAKQIEEKIADRERVESIRPSVL